MYLTLPLFFTLTLLFQLIPKIKGLTWNKKIWIINNYSI